MCINLNENAFLTLLLFDSCLPFAVADKAEEEKASVGGQSECECVLEHVHFKKRGDI